MSGRDVMRCLRLTLFAMSDFLGFCRNVPSSKSTEEHVNNKKKYFNFLARSFLVRV